MRRSGVRNFSFNIDKGLGTFLPAPGKPLDLVSIQGAVKKAGFPLLGAEATVRGSLRKVQDPLGKPALALAANETGQLFYLNAGSTPAEQEALNRISSWADKKAELSVHGKIHSPAGTHVGLSVLRFDVLNQGG